MNKKDKMKMTVGALVLIGLTVFIWKYAYTNIMDIDKINNQVFADALTTQESNETSVLNEDELEIFNGSNGQPAYVAVNGIIYDVTSVWNSGSHQGLQAGADVTTAFATSPHSMSILRDLPVVGILGQSVQVQEPTSNQLPQVQNPASGTSEWTTEKLAVYNGKNNQPAYIAVNGIIYDVTSVWDSGFHQGYQAGTDVTVAFAASPHSMSVLYGLPVVGIMGQIVHASEPTQPPQIQIPDATQPPQVQDPFTDTRMWTIEMLAIYNGKNSQPAYIAVNGIIYDVTSVWDGGFHQGYQAGTDVTIAFAASPHSMSILNGLPVVGRLGQSVQVSDYAQTTTQGKTPEPTQPSQEVATPPTDVSEWTTEKLALYNGKNGQPAYIAVNGTIYDVTSVWGNGSHQGYQAGMDVTAAFAASPHSVSTLNGLPVVGIMGQSTQAPESTQPPQVQAPETDSSEWTAEKLALYSGRNGQPAYIAVNGTIYDVTSVWGSGSHQGYQAGMDVTAAFAASPHSVSTLNGLPVVGIMGQSTQAPESTQPPQVQAPETDSSEWTAEKLALYNGRNGQPAYIAVNGTIYDVTSVWGNGSHQGYQAGMDVTAAFAASPHSASILNGLPIIGSYQSSSTNPVNPETDFEDDEHDDDYEDEEHDHEDDSEDDDD